jgi:hypothetical protein
MVSRTLHRPYGYKPVKKGLLEAVPVLPKSKKRKEVKMINLIILILRLAKAILELLSQLLK